MAKVAVPQAQRASWTIRQVVPVLVCLGWLALVSIVGGDMLAWGVQTAFASVLPILAGVCLLVLPGLALIQLLWNDQATRWDEKIALGCCVSIALPSLLLQVVGLVSIPWGRFASWMYVGVSAGVVLWTTRQSLRRISVPTISNVSLVLAGLTTLTLLVQLYMVRDLPVGMWGDSYHHTMIVQLLVNNGGMFSSWEPYAPLVTMTYHYGFHANAAFFHWLSGIPVTRSVVVIGQLINVVGILGMYVLTTRFTGNRAAGLWAAALTGFFNTQPIFYVNWGRYTQLTGHVILIAVLVSWQAVLERPGWSWRTIGLAAIVTACLMLTHYIVTIFAALFLAAYVTVLILRRSSPQLIVQVIGRSAATSTIALVLAAPWLATTLTGFLGRNLNGAVGQSTTAAATNPDASLAAITPEFLKVPILILAFIGMLLAVSRRDWRTLLFAVWTALLILSVVPFVFGLPGTGVITQFTAFIALYLTAVPLAAYALGLGQVQLDRYRHLLGLAVSTPLIVALTVWALSWQQYLIDAHFQLFRPVDRPAMEWIKTTTPPDAKFVVNSISAYGDTLIAGTDAGWWIPLLTERATNVPPMTYGSERAATPDYARRINTFAAALRKQPLPNESTIQLLRDQGYQYIYSGAHIGQPDRFDVAALRAHPAFKVVYDRDNVTIFELVQPATTP